MSQKLLNKNILDIYKCLILVQEVIQMEIFGMVIPQIFRGFYTKKMLALEVEEVLK
jgi:hypothetical protein